MVRVQDVMSRQVRAISPDETADEAYRIMRMRRIHHLVVMDGRHIAGVLSDRDLGSGQGAAARKGREVRELMTTGVVTVTPETPMRKAANLMRGRSIGCVVVTEAAKVVGIVTVSDLLALVGRGVEHPVEQSKRWTLKHSVPHRRLQHPTGVW